MYQDQETTSTNSKIESVIILVTDPDTGIEMRSEEAIAKGIVTEEEILELLKMKNDSSTTNNNTKQVTEIQRSVQTTSSSTCKKSVESSSSSSSSSSGSNSSSDEADNGSYRSELTIDFGNPRTPDVDHTVQTNVVFLKQGFVLCGMDSVRNMVTGEIMSFYEAKIRGIISDVKDSKAKSELSQQVKLFINEAVAKGLVNLYRGTFTNPMNGVELSIGEAIKHGLLITEIHQTEEIIEINAADQLTTTISLNDAFQHCFDAKTRKFWRQNSNDEKSSYFTLQESLEEHWINGQDVIFDVTTIKHNILAIDPMFLQTFL
jgi:protein required for attachment to host cells